MWSPPPDDFASAKPFKPSSHPHDDEMSKQESTSYIVPLRVVCGQVAVAVAWASQPAARSTRPETRAAGLFVGSRARGELDLQSGALDTMRARRHVELEELDPNAPQDVPLLALLSRAEHGGVGGAFRAFRFGHELQLIKSWMQTDRSVVTPEAILPPSCIFKVSHISNPVPLQPTPAAAAS